MEQWIYNNQLVERHSLYPSCPSTLNSVSNRDYPNTNYFNPEIKCLDIDSYEKQVLRKSQANNTVDAVIGVSSYINNKTSNPQLLLIELRMNYQTVNGLSKTIMERKVTYTKRLLGGQCTIKKESLFIFNDKMASQAKSWFNRQSNAGGELKNCITCSTSEFSNIIKSLSDFPYTPVNSKKNILNSIQPYYENTEWIDFMKEIRYWCTEAYKYRYKNPSEFEHIKDTITEIWKSFKQEKPSISLNEEEVFDMEFLEEDFEFLTK